MAVSDLPSPGVTPPNWGGQINAAITSRYEENRDRIDALEERVETYPWSGIEYTRAENATATPTTVAVSAAASITIPATEVTIDAGDGPFELQYTAQVGVTVAGGGLIVLELWDDAIPGGRVGFTPLGVVAAHVPLFSGGYLKFPLGVFRHEVSGSDTTYRLKALLYRDGGSSLTAAIANGAGGAVEPTVLKVMGI